MKALRVLLPIQSLEGTSGGALYVRDLAVGLLRQGHTPVVYSRRHGELAQAIRLLTVPVIQNLEALAVPPDIIDGNAPIETMAALLHFPSTPAIFVCHGWMSMDAMPPKFPRILRYLAVDETCRDRLLCEEGIPQSRVQIQFNSVDLARFTPRGPLPTEPRRALLFSNYASEETHALIVKEACARLGIQLDVVGEASGHPCPKPEMILGNYDLVFAKARCALEALAVGAAVVLCDSVGIGEMVTLRELDRLRRQNFGWRSLHNRLDVDLLVEEIKRYDPDDAADVSRRIRETEGLGERITSMVAIYREVISEYQQLAPSNADVELEATARYLEAIAPVTNTFHFAELQRALRAIAGAFHMQPLSDSDQQHIRFTITAVPSSVKVGESFPVGVALENDSSRLLCSYAPNPLRFSYHWLDAADGNPVVYEGRRTDIYPPLQPGSSLPYTVMCDAPPQEGAYILRLTLVQELIKWFDQDGTDRVKDVLISIIE